MRRDQLYLSDIIEAADHVDAFLESLDFEGFLKSELVRSAVAQKLSIIGEAAARVSEELRNRYPHIPWPQITAFRNILIHAYFGIDWNEVWKSARVDCPTLRGQVTGIMAKEFDGSAGDVGN